MKTFNVLYRCYKYGRIIGEHRIEQKCESREDAKRIAREYENSTDFSLDVTAKADLRTIRVY